MFLTNTLKKYKTEQKINAINCERDQAFNKITFETALKDATLYLSHGQPLKPAMLKSLVQRLSVGLPVGTHHIHNFEVVVSSDSTGLKSVQIKNVD